MVRTNGAHNHPRRRATKTATARPTSALPRPTAWFLAIPGVLLIVQYLIQAVTWLQRYAGESLRLKSTSNAEDLAMRLMSLLSWWPLGRASERYKVGWELTPRFWRTRVLAQKKYLSHPGWKPMVWDREKGEHVADPSTMKRMKWRGSVALSFVGTVTGTFPVFVIRRQGGVRNFQDEKDADSAVEAWASTEGSLAYRGVDMEKNESATFFSIFVLTSKCLFLTKLNIAECKNVDADVALLGALVNLVELKAGGSVELGSTPTYMKLKGERGGAEERERRWGSEGGCKRVGCSCARAFSPSQDTDAACTAFTPAGNAAWQVTSRVWRR